MPEQKRKMDLFGHQTDVTDVPITKATEFFNEYELEDGSVLRVKSVATAILRVEGQFNPDGKPIYLVLTSPGTMVLSSRLSKSTPPETKH